jgi:hypothetical protein
MAGYPMAEQRPRVIDRADLPPALGVLRGVALTGIPLGAIWAWLASAQRVQVINGGWPVPLSVETYHRFDDLAVFLLIGFGAGLLIGGSAGRQPLNAALMARMQVPGRPTTRVDVPPPSV